MILFSSFSTVSHSQDLVNRNTTTRLDERLKKLEFDWAKDKQTEEREVEKLNSTFDSLEKCVSFRRFSCRLKL
jgi:hypothetical protein